MSDPVNHWFDDRCARAFWDQKQALPYQDLLRHTTAWLEPQPGEHWLDLGCGCGQLTAQLWRLSEGRVGRILALDCAAANERAIARWRSELAPAPAPDQLLFRVADFSAGLPELAPASYDGVVSGLAISYAESRDPRTGRYTDAAYNRLLTEIARVLKPGGRLVFSVNVPDPNFWSIFWRSMRRGLRISHAGRLLINTWRIAAVRRLAEARGPQGAFPLLPTPGAAPPSGGSRVCARRASALLRPSSLPSSGLESGLSRGRNPSEVCLSNGKKGSRIFSQIFHDALVSSHPGPSPPT